MKAEIVKEVTPRGVRTASGYKNAMGNRRFSVGDMVFTADGYVFGHEPQRNKQSYVPEEIGFVIAESSGNESYARFIDKDLKEKMRVKLPAMFNKDGCEIAYNGNKLLYSSCGEKNNGDRYNFNLAMYVNGVLTAQENIENAYNGIEEVYVDKNDIFAHSRSFEARKDSNICQMIKHVNCKIVEKFSRIFPSKKEVEISRTIVKTELQKCRSKFSSKLKDNGESVEAPFYGNPSYYEEDYHVFFTSAFVFDYSSEDDLTILCWDWNTYEYDHGNINKIRGCYEYEGRTVAEKLNTTMSYSFRNGFSLRYKMKYPSKSDPIFFWNPYTCIEDSDTSLHWNGHIFDVGNCLDVINGRVISFYAVSETNGGGVYRLMPRSDSAILTLGSDKAIFYNQHGIILLDLNSQTATNITDSISLYSHDREAEDYFSTLLNRNIMFITKSQFKRVFGNFK